MKHLCAGALTLLLPAIAISATTGEEDRMVINPLNSTDFEVVQRSGYAYGAADYWCGAATFIERRNNRSELTPIYVKRPRGPSVTVNGKESVVFTTRAAGLPAAPSNGRTLSVREAGTVLKSVKARRYCRDAFTRSTK